MLRTAWDLARNRPLCGLAISVALHGVLVALMLLLALPAADYTVKRGEPLFVELPELPEPPPRGNPAAKSLARPRPARPPATPRTPPAAPPPRVAPAPPLSPPPVVASRPAVPPPPAPDVPSPAAGDLPTAAPKPETPVPDSAPAPPPAAEPAPPPGLQVASVPPSPDVPPPIDIRSALGRQGGAGSAQGGGRGGIEGEPIPLDSRDPKYSDYLDRVRRKIKANWGYPCVKNADTRECEYKTTRLVVEFGIAKDGRVPFVTVVRSSGWPIYDDYAVNAIKLSVPFPPVPDALSKKGIPIMATFNYVVDTSLTNLLR